MPDRRCSVARDALSGLPGFSLPSTAPKGSAIVSPSTTKGEKTMHEEQTILAMSRRNLVRGGLLAAVATPLIASQSASAACDPPYPRIGHRVVASGDRVLGISACVTDAALVRPPSNEIRNNQVQYSDALIRGLLQVSLFNGDGDPRTMRVQDPERVNAALSIVLKEERMTIGRLRDADLFWVQSNPWFLYGIGRGLAIAIVPFVVGFAEQLGSHAADWLVDQFRN